MSDQENNEEILIAIVLFERLFMPSRHPTFGNLTLENPEITVSIKLERNQKHQNGFPRANS